MKYFYKFVALFFIFCISIFLFMKGIPEATAGTTTATSLQDATFPIMYLQLNKHTVNTLHGYSSELNSGNVRESVTPLDTDKTFTVKIKENNSKIKKLDYELRNIASDTVIEEDTLSALSSEDDYKTAKITLSEAIDTSTEYGMKITLTTNLSKKIHFYTRIKYYENDFYLKEKLDFVKSFHDATFDNGKSLDITNYLEPNTSDNSTFANVTINSSYNLVTWGKLKPKIISDVVPTIKELNIETAAIQQSYYVTAKTSTGNETYLVKEFYRVRYSGNRMYLLYFKRNMEAEFNPKYISLTKNELKIGISDVSDFCITSSSDNKKFCFVRNGSLWYYDLEKKQLNSVFSFSTDNSDYLRDCYDQHDIKILKFSDDGTISFLVYGYMNCGDYEGRVGILLYDYSPENNQITERVYIPLETTYEQLKEDLGDFCYVNDKNNFYFSLSDKVYAYNISSKKYDVLSKNATKDDFVMLEGAKCFVWSNASESGHAGNITILNLDTTKELIVSAKKKQSIVVLGTIDANVVYGYVKNSDIYESTSGEVIQPIYKLVISDCDGNILRVYKNKNIYVTDASVENNVIRLTRVKKVNGKFKKISDDSILNQKTSASKLIDVTTRNTEKALVEKYISLPAGYVLEELPTIDATKYVTVTQNTTVHLNNVDSNTYRYYIYAHGGITASLTNVSEAIQLADEQMGVVMDNKSHVIWERGGKFLSKELSGISYPSGSSSSIKSCTQMLLQAAQTTVDIEKLEGNSITSMLSKYLKQPVDLTGCTLDEVLYFVSNERPVVGMLDNSHAVLITAYTSSTVTWMDPATSHSTTMPLTSAESMFKNAGYVFVSYID